MRVELLYFEDCPHWRLADERLREAIDLIAEHDVQVIRRQVGTVDADREVGMAGSPTILIDGIDAFSGGQAVPKLACRLFSTPEGLAGAPTVQQLVGAMREAVGESGMVERSLDQLALGNSALNAGDWAAARAAFEAALQQDGDAAGHDGLARVLWWTDGPGPAIAERTKAYSAYRRSGDTTSAARVAVWIAHEYEVGLRNPAAAGGWLSRAEGLLAELAENADHARLYLVHAERSLDPLEARGHAKTALEIARRLGDADLEITALGRLGLAEVRVGAVESGMSRIDEAMAAALGGEAMELETLGELCCALLSACDQTGDVDRLQQWNRLLGEATHERRELPVMSFCGCCSAEALLAGGRLEDAERELARALRVAEQSGTHGRCVDPRARLGDLLVRQGRFEEAEQLLPGADGDGWTVRARAELHLARSEYGAAGVVLERRLRQIGSDSLLAVTVLDLVVQTRLAGGDVDGAATAAKELDALAQSSQVDRVRAYADRALGRVAASTDPAAGIEQLERAAAGFARLGMELESGRTRLDLARALRTVDRQAAIGEGRRAMSALHSARASYERDMAAALLRDLGDEARPPTAHQVEGLTSREVEVLQLLGEGLTNAEIAQRLFISTKTAGNHVSSILMKLGLRNRSQAAAMARTRLGIEQGAG
jgi:DNA-binding NarL/FixJ family response regulator